MTLLEKINTLNAVTRAWVNEDPSKRWAGLLTKDLQYWAESGVTTADELEYYLDCSEYSDMYKSVNGFRPRDFPSASEIQEEIRSLEARLEEYHEMQEQFDILESRLEEEDF